MESPSTHIQDNHRFENSPYSDSDEMTLFEAKGVSFGYEPNSIILKNISLTLNTGDFLFITGKTGSGKTSLLNFIDSDKNFRYIQGHRSRLHSQDDLLFSSRVYQDLKVFKDMSVADNLELAFDQQIYDNYQSFFDTLKDYLEIFGLKEQLRTKLASSNGATSQKVAIIRSILSKPRLILADEPTSSFDQQTTHKVYDLFNLLNQKTQMSVVWVTHDKDLVQKFRGRIYQIENQRMLNVRRHCFT